MKANFLCLFSGGVIDSRRIFFKVKPSVVNSLCKNPPLVEKKTYHIIV